MDAGNLSARSPSLSIRKHRRRNSHDDNLDRFIPNRAAMDFDFANYMLTGRKVEKESASPYSPWRESYQKQLAEIFNVNRPRILAFKNKPPTTPLDGVKEIPTPSTASKRAKRMRDISQSSERTLDAPELVDDYYLNLLDWGVTNTIAIALGNSVYLWDASEGMSSELLSTNNDIGPVTSVKWAPDGRHIAVGFNNSEVQLWDSSTNRLLRTLRGHGLRVGSLDWNNHILTTGSMDSLIINNDVRIRSHNIGTYRGHHQEVCGLKWSTSGQQLASGGNDNLLFIWDRSSNQRLHRFSDHSSAVKALAWCPFQSNLLASGGGIGDQCVKFWNSNTGVCLNSVNTGSQVSCLLWNRHEREILSSHGFDDNQLILWKYPSMVKLAELHGHTKRVLHMSQSPDGYKVASLGADETLRFWNVFGTPEVTKNVKAEEPFASFARIR
ncbi:hypothetical protein OSB04_010850 [Centaurea solstitialis]|uniref:CDC20/Fizzy WD40 domain-containing protein n=1 Tax=Centaurea solstitialis TaxID=347529 RepID=A0AA38WPN6_9ASTR|nr:hypothetical protein OSB04_010850 [Centaurea solstitialis]